MLTKTTSLIVIFLSSLSFGHGMDEPGPHGGMIQMPGAYHVEVVKEKDLFKIYLLDAEFANPVIKDSNVKAKIVSGKKISEVDCKPVESISGFECSTKLKNKKFTLIIESVRSGAKGNEAKFEFK